MQLELFAFWLGAALALDLQPQSPTAPYSALGALPTGAPWCSSAAPRKVRQRQACTDRAIDVHAGTCGHSASAAGWTAGEQPPPSTRHWHAMPCRALAGLHNATRLRWRASAAPDSRYMWVLAMSYHIPAAAVTTRSSCKSSGLSPLHTDLTLDDYLYC